IQRLPLLASWKAAAKTPFTNTGNPWWLVLLVVVTAPVFEEYIFRGLVYRGMRQSAAPWLATIGSAAIFAVVHPAISALPVFLLGIAAALSFERTRLLLAPILTHMIYNACILWV